MRRDGVALVLAVLVPVIAFAILTLTFSNAVIRNLRVTDTEFEPYIEARFAAIRQGFDRIRRRTPPR